MDRDSSAQGRAQASQRRRNIVRENLEPNERQAIAHALSIVANIFDKDAKQARDIAAEIRAGKSVPMFASGESGAKGAERLAEQFEKQAKDSRELIDWLE